jgi:hypothetical protein
MVLLSLVAVSGCTTHDGRKSAGAAAAARREWLLVFHLPYDNDLDGLAERVLADVMAEVPDERLVATMLVDRAGEQGLRRAAVTGGQLVSDERLDTDDSSDVSVFEEYLGWAAATFPARRRALFLLGHGGRLDEVSLDISPAATPDAGARWASGVSVAAAIRRWRSSPADSDLELLFLQQCGRATIENLYSFRDTAEVIVASETFVGAPNSYYRPVLRRLRASPDMSGQELAEAILDSETEAAALAVFGGHALGELPGLANTLVDALRRPDGRRLARPQGQVSAYGANGEVTYDLCTFVGELAAANGLGANPTVVRSLAWVSRDLIIARRDWDQFFPSVDRAWCGVATYIPWRSEEVGEYDDLPFYRDSRWRQLIERLAAPRVIPESPEVVYVSPAQADAGQRDAE